MIEQWEAGWSDDWVRMRLHCSFAILGGVGAQQGLNKGAPIACIWCFLKLSSVICAPPAFLRFERKRLTEIAHDRWHIIAQNVLLLIFISNASIISLNTDNVCVTGKWDKRTGHNAPLRPRWDFLIVFFVWSKSRTEIVFGDFWLIDYLLPIVGWLVCVTCYTFQPINYNAVANLFRVHCVGWWWLTCLYPICGFDIYIGAILASSCFAIESEVLETTIEGIFQPLQEKWLLLEESENGIRACRL